MMMNRVDIHAWMIDW